MPAFCAQHHHHRIKIVRLADQCLFDVRHLDEIVCEEPFHRTAYRANVRSCPKFFELLARFVLVQLRQTPHYCRECSRKWWKTWFALFGHKSPLYPRLHVWQFSAKRYCDARDCVEL